MASSRSQKQSGIEPVELAVADRLSVIPFKSQLSDLSYEGTRRWSLCVDLHQHLSSFF